MLGKGAYSSFLLYQIRSGADGPGLASLRRFSSFSFALRCLRSRQPGPHLRRTIRGIGVANKHIPDKRTNVQPAPIASLMIWTTDTEAAPKRHRTRLNWLQCKYSTYCPPRSRSKTKGRPAYRRCHGATLARKEIDAVDSH